MVAPLLTLVVLADLLLGPCLLSLPLSLVLFAALRLLLLFFLASALACVVLLVLVFHGGLSWGKAGVPAVVAPWGKQTPTTVTQP